MDIQGIDKVLLLKKLWEGSAPARFFQMSGMPAPTWDEEAAKKAVLGYIDYFQGRVIKMNIHDKIIKTDLYDRDNGQGAAGRAVEAARLSAR